MTPHAVFHFGVILEPPNLAFKQFNGLIFDGVLISQPGQVDTFRRFG